jgi:hypothetical protein
MSYMQLHLHHLSPPRNISLVNYSEEGGSNAIQNPNKLPINSIKPQKNAVLLLMVCSSQLDFNMAEKKETVIDTNGFCKHFVEKWITTAFISSAQDPCSRNQPATHLSPTS